MAPHLRATGGVGVGQPGPAAWNRVDRVLSEVQQKVSCSPPARVPHHPSGCRRRALQGTSTRGQDPAAQGRTVLETLLPGSVLLQCLLGSEALWPSKQSACGRRAEQTTLPDRGGAASSRSRVQVCSVPSATGSVRGRSGRCVCLEKVPQRCCTPAVCVTPLGCLCVLPLGRGVTKVKFILSAVLSRASF